MIIHLQVEEARFAAAAVSSFNILLEVEKCVSNRGALRN